MSHLYETMLDSTRRSPVFWAMAVVGAKLPGQSRASAPVFYKTKSAMG